MKEEMLEIKANFAKPRKTVIVAHHAEMTDLDLIQCEDVVLTITRDGYIKKTPLDNYKGQKRSGRGRSTMKMGDEDLVQQMLVTTSHHKVLFFSNQGKVYQILAYQIPLGSLQGKGRALVNLLDLQKDEKITNMIALQYLDKE